MRDEDVRIVGVKLYFLPIQTRVPLKFGPETMTSVTCARVQMTVSDSRGRMATGWGETPLSVQWVWPSDLPYSDRHETLKQFTRTLARAWSEFDHTGHPIEMGHEFTGRELKRLWLGHNQSNSRAFSLSPLLPISPSNSLPWLAALVCSSP